MPYQNPKVNKLKISDLQRVIFKVKDGTSNDVCLSLCFSVHVFLQMRKDLKPVSQYIDIALVNDIVEHTSNLSYLQASVFIPPVSHWDHFKAEFMCESDPRVQY